MRNLALRLMYDGTDFHGWQVQPNGITVQECLQDAVEKILGVRESITGCSRTDAGVHANDFCCTLRTESSIECCRLTGALNAVLPDCVAVKSCKEVPLDFHPRYDCKSKRYLYRIWNSQTKNPFLTNYAWHYKSKLDADVLNEQAKQFIGTHDFAGFCSSGSSVEDTVRTIYDCGVVRNGDEVDFDDRTPQGDRVNGDEIDFDDRTPQGERVNGDVDGNNTRTDFDSATNPHTGVGLDGAVTAGVSAAAALAAAGLLLGGKRKKKDKSEE